MITDPPEGFSLSANVDSSIYEDFLQTPEQMAYRRLLVRIFDRFFHIVRSPRCVPIITNCNLVHVDGCIVPLTSKPWIVGGVEHSSGFFSYDDNCFARTSMRNRLLHLLTQPRCKRILTLSRAAVDSFRPAFGRDFRLIENRMGVLYPAVPSRLLSLHKMKRDDGLFRILFVGTPFFDKGGRELARAFIRLRERYDVELDIVSSVAAHQQSLYESFQSSVGLVPGMRFHSRVPRVVLWRDFFAKSDMFCLPSYIDTFGYVLLEAMANHLPIVATDEFAIPEIVRHEETGLLVHAPVALFERERMRTAESIRAYQRAVLDEKPFQPLVDSLVSAIASMIESDSKRKRFASAAYHEVSEGRFSVGHRNGALSEYYNEALE